VGEILFYLKNEHEELGVKFLGILFYLLIMVKFVMTALVLEQGGERAILNHKPFEG